jgi:hypothetical protein
MHLTDRCRFLNCPIRIGGGGGMWRDFWGGGREEEVRYEFIKQLFLSPSSTHLILPLQLPPFPPLLFSPSDSSPSCYNHLSMGPEISCLLSIKLSMYPLFMWDWTYGFVWGEIHFSGRLKRWALKS